MQKPRRVKINSCELTDKYQVRWYADTSPESSDHVIVYQGYWVKVKVKVTGAKLSSWYCISAGVREGTVLSVTGMLVRGLAAVGWLPSMERLSSWSLAYLLSG